MKHFRFSRKRRQLKYLAKRIRQLLAANDGVVNAAIERLVAKMKKILQGPRPVISLNDLRKSLGAAVLLLGLGFGTPAVAQNFAPLVENPFGLDTIPNYIFPTFADLDGDGDMDLIVGQYEDDYSGEILFVENVGTPGTPSFATPTTLLFGTSPELYINFPTLTDLDDDGDLDLLLGNNEGNFEFFENTGDAFGHKFTTDPLVNPFGLSQVDNIASPHFVDLDDDGDMDILCSEYDYYLGNFIFFQNVGNPIVPNFATGVLSPFGLNSVDVLNFPTVADFDGDGDSDVLSADYDATFQYFQNAGSANAPFFANSVENPFGLSRPIAEEDIFFPAAVDLDSDGDVDLMVTDYFGVFQYYENMTTNPVGTNDVNGVVEVKLFPNPVSEELTIQTNWDWHEYELMDQLGRKVAGASRSANTIAMSGQAPGMYFLRLLGAEGKVIVRKVEIK